FFLYKTYLFACLLFEGFTCDTSVLNIELFRSTNSRWDVNQSRKKGYSVKIGWEK
ncbi:unnamed protein product, partial [Musa acuminata subsp. burmannicoides]